jgi:Ankyrin repeats (3 copies)
LATDGSGYPAAVHATSPEIDRSVMEALRARGSVDLVTALALREWGIAERLLVDRPTAGALHLTAKRGDVDAVRWLLDHGADPNARWSHWDAEVTPLHLAALGDHPDVVRALLDADADPRIHDTKHDSDAIGWAEFFRRAEVLRLLEAHRAAS